MLAKDKQTFQGNNQYGFGTAINVAVVTVLTSTPIFLPGATSQLISKSINFGPGGIGVIFTLYWLFSVVGAYISRNDHRPFSIQKRISQSVLITALALAFIAIYPQFGIWVGPAIGGAVYGYSQPYTNLLIMKECSNRIHGFAYGLKQAAIPAATLISSLAVPIIAVPLGWRQLFGIIAFFTLIYSLFLAKNSQTIISKSQNKSTAKLKLNWHLSMLALTGSLGAMVGNSLGGYLIISLTDSGFSLTAASFIAAVSSVANIIVRIIAGVAADRGKKSPYRYLEFMFVFGMIGTLFLLTNINSIQIIGSILAYAGGWGWAGLLHYVTGAAYPGKERQATAVSQMGVSLGASFGPLIFGCLFSYAGAQIAWISLFIACAVAMITVLIAYRIEYKNSEKNMESVI